MQKGCAEAVPAFVGVYPWNCHSLRYQSLRFPGRRSQREDDRDFHKPSKDDKRVNGVGRAITELENSNCPYKWPEERLPAEQAGFSLLVKGTWKGNYGTGMEGKR